MVVTGRTSPYWWLLVEQGALRVLVQAIFQEAGFVEKSIARLTVAGSTLHIYGTCVHNNYT